jgi:hypothetical protein
MTIKLSGSLTISDIIAEFGGASPNSLSNYYAGGPNVPSTTVGFPNGVRTNVPSSGAISFSNFYGASDEYRTSFSMFGIYSGGGNADNLYFGGDIPRNGGVYINRNSNDFRTFSIPEGYGNATLTASAWQVQLACGYTWYDPGPYNSTDYYYDYQRNFGIMVFDVTTNTVAGYIRNTANTNGYTGTFNTYTVPAGTINLVSGRTYRVYYTCDFRRDSDPGYGDVSFGWSNNSNPFISVLAN